MSYLRLGHAVSDVALIVQCSVREVYRARRELRGSSERDALCREVASLRERLRSLEELIRQTLEQARTYRLERPVAATSQVAFPR
jgi:hypothetical protein